MIVIAGLLHEVSRSPENGKGRKGKPVKKSHHHHQAENSHEGIVKIHAIPRQWGQPLKTNKCEGEFRVYKNPLNPAGKYGTGRFQKNQQPENQPEKDQSTIVDWLV